MKEATGDLNLTLVIVILVASFLAFFISVVWPTIKKSIGSTADCQKAICTNIKNSDGTVECATYDENGRVERTFTCTWKG